jgi:hypothetical protein
MDWNALSTYSNLITAGAAVLALALAMGTYRQARKHHREQLALESYRGYLQTAMQYPECSGYNDCVPVSARSRVRYKWYVANMLLACEQVLVNVPDDLVWKKIIAKQMNYHRTYLESAEFRWGLYSQELQDVWFCAICKKPWPDGSDGKL